MSWIKVILINIGIAFSLLGMLLMAPPISYSIYSLVSGKDGGVSSDQRGELFIYEQLPWAKTHFEEFSALPTTYYDFITWRRNDFAGETINIVNGIRTTIGSQAQNSKKEHYYFFGGSTTWGTGVNDANTYPSLFAQIANVSVTNLGETAYIARQSLAYLNNYIINNSIDDMSRKHVVFYDGINDVFHRCRSEISGLATGRESQIQKRLSQPTKLSRSRGDEFSFLKTFSQITELLSSITRKLGLTDNTYTTENYYSCALDAERAEEVATTLVNTWLAASELVKSKGGEFTAVLQPVAYLGNPIIKYLNLTTPNDMALAEQYSAVYPLVMEMAEKRNIRFINLTQVYDGCGNCYIDFCHVGPQGHQILVPNLIKHLDL